MRPLARIGGIVTLASLVLAGAACGGGGDKKAATATPGAAVTSASESPTAKASSGKNTPTKAPSSSKTSSATGTPKAGGTPAATNGLDSYHYVVGIKFEISNSRGGVDGKIEGDYVGPNSHSFKQTFDVAGITGEESTVIIGDDAWLKKTSGDWTKTRADDPDVVSSLDLTSADPSFFADPKFVEDIKVFSAQDDTVDGRKARRYDFDREQFAKLGDAFGSSILSPTELAGITDFKMSVWVDSATDALVKAELSAGGPAEGLLKDSPLTSKPGDTAAITLTFEITQVNDKTIKIVAPI